MKANDENMLDYMFMNRRQYHIPVYQRNYDWKKENCILLYNDIIQAAKNDKKHFFGSIVQVNLKEENGINNYLIIDGQQRMTSVYLLLKALYDLETHPFNKEDLERLLFNFRDSKKYSNDLIGKLKLKPIKTDNKQFEYLMSGNVEKMDDTSNIKINYELFKLLIKDSIKCKIETSKILRGIKNLEVVMITLQEEKNGLGDNPQEVFERINSTGEDLTLSDLIRNFALMTDLDREQLFENYWLPVENTIKKDKLNDFVLAYLLFKMPDSTTEKNAYQTFKKYVEKNQISNKEILEDLKKYSKYYNVFINDDYKNYSKKTNNLLSVFRVLKQTTIYPFLFSVFEDYENSIIDENVLNSVLQFFVTYIIRRSICSIPTNSLRGLFKTLYKRIFQNEKSKEEYLKNLYGFMASLTNTKDSVPSNENFEDSLKKFELYKNSKLCKYLLSTIENGNLNFKERIEINENITIEHIMPRNKTSYWRNEIGANYDAVYDKYLNTIGNLTLTGYNSELSDKPFKSKKISIEEFGKFNTLNKDIKNCTIWNEDSIVKRANRLSNIVCEIFYLPQEVFDYKIVEDEIKQINIDDKIDLTFTKPVYFNLLGEMVDSTSYGELIKKVSNILYYQDPMTMKKLAQDNYKLPNGTSVQITNDPKKLNKAIEIDENSGIYIEGTKNANAVITYIKAILSEFDISHDDFIVFTKKVKNK